MTHNYLKYIKVKFNEINSYDMKYEYLFVLKKHRFLRVHSKWKYILCFYVVSYCISWRPFPCYLLSIVWSRLSDLDGPQLTKKPQRVTSWSKLNSCHWPVTKTPPIYHFRHNFRRSFQLLDNFVPIILSHAHQSNKWLLFLYLYLSTPSP